MKRLLSLLLLACFLYQVAGIFVVFKIQQQSIRKEIKRQIKLGVPEGDLHVISITEKNYRDLAWHNHKEFTYRGVMYDVVHKKITGETSVVYQCVSDEQETQLFANLDRQVDHTTDAKHQGKNPLKLITNLLYLTPDRVELLVGFYSLIKDRITASKFSVSDQHLLGVFNPPDFC